MLSANQQQPWKLKIHAKSNKFHFKLKATVSDPAFKFLKVSLFLKLCRFFLHLKTESRPSIPRKQTASLKSKFLRIFQKSKISRGIPADKASVTQNPESKVTAHPLKKSKNEEPICIGSLFVANFALLSKSIGEKDEKGIVVHGLSVLFFLALFFKKCVTGKAIKACLIIITFLTVLTVMIPLDKLILCGNRNYYVSQLVWKGWKYVTSSGFLYVTSQAILSTLRQSAGVHFRSK